MAAGDLVTLAQLKARLDISDVTDDVLLAELISDVSDWINDFVRPYYLAPEPATTYLIDTVAGSVIDWPRGIRIVTSLAIATTDQPDDGSGTYTTVVAADIFLRPLPQDRQPGWPPTQIVLRGTGTGRLVSARNAAKLVGDGGFAAVPNRVQEIALDALTVAYTTRGRAGAGVIGEDDTPVRPWSEYFAEGSPQRQTLRRIRGGRGIA